jgi:hypothetical protein
MTMLLKTEQKLARTKKGLLVQYYNGKITLEQLQQAIKRLAKHKNPKPL